MARIPRTAYEEYLALGEKRSYQALAERYKVSKTAVAKKAKKERWQERISELERKARERAELKAFDDLEAVRQRQLAEARFLQTRAVQVLKNQPPEKGIRAASALAIAWRQELLLLGEPTARQANENCGVLLVPPVLSIEEWERQERNRTATSSQTGANIKGKAT